MKFTSMFFTASAVYFRALAQRYIQTSEIVKACFGISQRVQYIFAVYRKGRHILRGILIQNLTHGIGRWIDS